ncbi:hypothetical protein C1H46_036412 [Malus baccata]|uniref:Uncharacterized protein n=1 Tax=Malus baccata TaxID=106549 RepID=A0A540KUZ5_MALBA|nr:hypothetical protein C1H46_036412 [Malus baccata]
MNSTVYYYFKLPNFSIILHKIAILSCNSKPQTEETGNPSPPSMEASRSPLRDRHGSRSSRSSKLIVATQKAFSSSFSGLSLSIRFKPPKAKGREKRSRPSWTSYKEREPRRVMGNLRSGPSRDPYLLISTVEYGTDVTASMCHHPSVVLVRVECVESHHRITEGSSSVHQAKKPVLGYFLYSREFDDLEFLFLHLLTIFRFRFRVDVLAQMRYALLLLVVGYLINYTAYHSTRIVFHFMNFSWGGFLVNSGNWNCLTFTC